MGSLSRKGGGEGRAILLLLLLVVSSRWWTGEWWLSGPPPAGAPSPRQREWHGPLTAGSTRSWGSVPCRRSAGTRVFVCVCVRIRQEANKSVERERDRQREKTEDKKKTNTGTHLVLQELLAGKMQVDHRQGLQQVLRIEGGSGGGKHRPKGGEMKRRKREERVGKNRDTRKTKTKRKEREREYKQRISGEKERASRARSQPCGWCPR